MDMLHLGFPPTERLGEEGVIKLLRVLIENVCVSLDWRNCSYFINLLHDARKGSKHGSGLTVFVAVTSDDDIGFRILV